MKKLLFASATIALALLTTSVKGQTYFVKEQTNATTTSTNLSGENLLEAGFTLKSSLNSKTSEVILFLPSEETQEFSSVAVVNAQGDKLELPKEYVAKNLFKLDFSKQEEGEYIIHARTKTGHLQLVRIKKK